MPFLVSTTGTNVILQDLGIQVDDPTVDRDLLLEFSSEELAESSDLQAAITGATLTANDGTNPITNVGASSRPPHAATHEAGAVDELDVTGLSGILASPQVPLAHAALHESGGLDEINVGGLSGVLADDQPAQAHDFAGVKHTPSTLAEVNSKISDATLDDASDPRTPVSHGNSHEDGGADEINVNGLSGVLADPQTPASHAATHENGGADEISVAGLSGVLADDQPAQSHAFAGAKHTASTLAQVNGLISDATLDDASDPRTPVSHGNTHEDGGADEINVNGLSGVLADDQPAQAHAFAGAKHTASTLAQVNSLISDATLDDAGDPRTPTAHASTHEDGGADEINVGGLSGVLADDQPAQVHAFAGTKHTASTLADVNSKISDATLDDQNDPRTPTSHASTHESGGADEINVGGLSGALADPQTPTAHKASHVAGGADEFTSADFLNAVVARLRETGGPADLLMGAVADGEYLRRSGTDIIGDTPAGSATSEHFNLYTTAQQSVPVNPTWLEIDWQAQRLITSGFTHTPGSSQVTVVAGGTYFVGYFATLENDTGNRRIGNARLTLNGSPVLGTGTNSYHRTASEGDDTATGFAVLTLSPGDVLAVEVQNNAGGAGDLDTIAGRSGFLAFSFGGAQGPQGPAGGSTIDVADGGVAVPNGPFTELDFGSGLTATDQGGGSALIEAPGSVFGTEKSYAESLAQVSTASAAFQSKLAYTTPALVGGTYRIEWTFEGWASAFSAAEYQFQLDAVTQSQTVIETIFAAAVLPNLRSGWLEAVLAPGTHNLELLYRSVTGGTAFIQNARFSIYRVL